MRPALTVEQARARLEERRERDHICGRHTLRGRNREETIYIRLYCKCWNCKRCGPKKAGRYKHAIRREAERFKLQRFLTLTLDPKKLPDPSRAVPYLRECFNELRTCWRRRYGQKVKYIAVLEFQKNGMPHLHILVDRYMNQQDVKADWQAVGGGQHVDIRFVDLHRVSRYLSKYLTKELLMSAPSRSRRVTVSRGITLNPKRKTEHKWHRLKVAIMDFFRAQKQFARDAILDIETDELESFVVPAGTLC